MAVETKSVSKTSPREVLERAKAEGVEVVDVRFIDLPRGKPFHRTAPPHFLRFGTELGDGVMRGERP